MQIFGYQLGKVANFSLKKPIAWVKYLQLVLQGCNSNFIFYPVRFGRGWKFSHAPLASAKPSIGSASPDSASER